MLTGMLRNPRPAWPGTGDRHAPEYAAGQYAELLDPSVGPAIRREAGAFYVLMSWSGLFFVIAGAVIGLLVRRHHRGLTKTY